MRRFFLKEPMQSEMVIGGEDAHHMMRVLRFKVGELIIVVDCNRKIAEVRITGFGEQSVKLELLRFIEADTEAPVEVILAQCLPKSDKMDFIVQKAVELGISSIYPVISENCIVKYDAAKKVLRQQKWQKIACEAAKQCGRTIVPSVEPIAGLQEVLSGLDPTVESFLCYEGQAEKSIKELLENSTAKRFFILIGPEGGFSPIEVTMCRGCGLKTVTMGSRILRTETAALAAVSLVMYQKGDLGGKGGSILAKSCANDVRM